MADITITEKTLPRPQKAKPFNWREHAITHDQLLQMQLTPLEFLVDGLIVKPSLCILAAPKKRAKSWMGLQLSQCVASGNPFLGLTTRQGAVIHMALEDGDRRLRQRLEMQHAPTGLPITYVSKFTAFNSKEGFQELTDMIKEKHPALLVVDTLAAAKNRFIDENSAGDTADLFNHLHELTIGENLVILVIAHHGKASSGDAGFDIRGSSAIPGATDLNIGLYKNTDGTCDLKAEGRDIGEVDMRIKFDAEQTWSWQSKGDAKDVRREEAENNILDAIDFMGGNVDAGAIADELGLNRSTVQTQLQRMRDEGTVAFKLEKVGRQNKCLYKRPPTSSTSSTSSIKQHHLLPDQGVDDVANSLSLKHEPIQAQTVDDVDDDINTRITSVLGMPIEESLTIWRAQGAPIIYLGPGQTCQDLVKLLTKTKPLEHELNAVKSWLDKYTVTMSRS
jgi:hypothetical protein